MQKKKSKTQKYKKSVKRKQIKNATTQNTKNISKKNIANKEEVIYNVAITNPEIINKKNTKTTKKTSPKKTTKSTTVTKKQPAKKTTTKKTNNNVQTIKKENKFIIIFKIVLNSIINFFKKIGTFFKNIYLNIRKKFYSLFTIKTGKKVVVNNKKKTNKKKNTKKKTTTKIISENKITNQPIVLPKIKKKSKLNKKIEELSKMKVFKILKAIYNKSYYIFNSALIIIFVLLILGMIRVNVFNKNTIIYIACIFGFLSIVAIAFNKYISGKVFTLIIGTIMGLAVYYLQYTYDFIRNLDTERYEYKTYYVVSFDNKRNINIYNLNNKKIGLIKENSTNIERKLDTKLDKITYIEYDNLYDLYNDFYDQKYRAIIVNQNQYQYLLNNSNNKAVKILYEFEVNALK